jgi:hypothetical protein
LEVWEVPVTVEMLNELIRDAERARDSTEAELAEAESTVTTLNQKLMEIREEEKSFRAALARRFPNADAAKEPVPTEPDSWMNVSRTIAVERAIREMNQTFPTVSPGDIETCLARHGRDDDRDEIGGATAYLNKHNRIHSLGRGKWVYGPKPGASNDFGSASSEAEPREANPDDNNLFEGVGDGAGTSQPAR